MKKLPLIIFTVLLFNCSNSKKVLLEKENPASFLSINETPWTKGAKVVKGVIANNSSATEYSNIIMIVQYYSSAGNNIGTERLVEYAPLKSGGKREYLFKINPPNLTERIVTIIERAQVLDLNEKVKH